MTLRLQSIILLCALGGAAAGCVGDVGEASNKLLVCGPKDDAIKDDVGVAIGALHVTNDYDSMQLQIDVASGFTGVKIYLGPPPPPVPFSGGDLVLSTIEESFPSTTTKTYDISFEDIGVPCSAETKIVVKVYRADGSVAWAWSTNLDYVYYPGGIPYDYYRACEMSCEPPPPPPPPPSDGCTYTQGYWKNHFDAWPVSSLVLGRVSYDADELLLLLTTPTRGDESLILAHQLITAKLNLLAGASDPDIGRVIADADAWLAANEDADGELPYGRGTDPARAEAIWLAAALDEFNNGLTGPGHCD